MRTLSNNVIKLAPVMLQFDQDAINHGATEISDATELARLKELIMSKQKEVPQNLSVGVKDFKIVKAYLMPGMRVEMIRTPRFLYKCVPGELKAPTGASSPFVMRALTFVNGPKRPVRVGSKGNLWMMNRPTGAHTPPGTQPGNESDVYATAYNPLILCLVEITAVV